MKIIEIMRDYVEIKVLLWSLDLKRKCQSNSLLVLPWRRKRWRSCQKKYFWINPLHFTMIYFQNNRLACYYMNLVFSFVDVLWYFASVFSLQGFARPIFSPVSSISLLWCFIFWWKHVGVVMSWMMLFLTKERRTEVIVREVVQILKHFKIVRLKILSEA